MMLQNVSQFRMLVIELWCPATWLYISHLQLFYNNYDITSHNVTIKLCYLLMQFYFCSLNLPKSLFLLSWLNVLQLQTKYPNWNLFGWNFNLLCSGMALYLTIETFATQTLWDMKSQLWETMFLIIQILYPAVWS